MKLNAALENAVRDLGPDFNQNVKTPDGVPYSKVVTGMWLRQNSMRDFLVLSAVAGTAGSVILMLATLGIYGVVGWMVASRTREIAVRVALGASRRGVLGMILLDVVKLVMPGVAVGLVLTATSFASTMKTWASRSATWSPWLTSSVSRSQYLSQSSPASPLHAAPRRSSRWWPCDRYGISESPRIWSESVGSIT